MGVFQSKILEVKAWKSKGSNLFPTDYPELDTVAYPELNAKPSTALCISGGGSRAMIGAFGFLAGLRDLGLLDKIKYIGGVSGGGWATTIYLYSQVTKDDDILLGKVVSPEDITLDNLNDMDEHCARRFASVSFLDRAYTRIVTSRSKAWIEAISQSFLVPSGIHPGQLYSWNQRTVKDIVERNKHVGLKEEDFLLPRKENGPFLLLGWALLGPALGLFDPPYNVKHHNFTFIECTPLYIGSMKNIQPTYSTSNATKLDIGGVIEPYAFPVKGGKHPKQGLSKDQSYGILHVPKPRTMCDLTNVTSTSSLNPEELFASEHVLDVVFDWTYNYWSPAQEHPISHPTTFGDGGNIQNIPMIPFLQRGVQKIVNINISYSPIAFDKVRSAITSPDWNTKRQIYTTDFDPWIVSFFGIIPILPKSDAATEEFSKNCVFKFEEFTKLFDGVERSFQTGEGVFYRDTFTTVDNSWYGIKGGQSVDVTFYIMTICNQWKSKLPSSVQQKVFDTIPESSYCGCGKPKNPEFYSFPHYPVAATRLTHSESNLLANMVGWSVKQHRELLQNVLS